MGSFKKQATLFSMIGTAALLVAACGSSTAKTGSTSGSTSAGYDFSYKPTIPTTKGGNVVIGDWQFPDTLSPIAGVGGALVVDVEVTSGLFNGCVVQLPDLTLGAAGWKPDQCSEVPTVANGDESADLMTTTMKLDPKAVWSDGQPITADDYMLQYDFATDPNIGGDPSPFNEMKSVTKVDNNTIKIQWAAPYAPYLTALWGPVPAHVYNAGKYAGLVDATGKYNTTIAQNLITDPIATTNITVDNGAFTVDSFSNNDSVVMKANPKFYSNFFKGPFVNEVIFKTTNDKNVLIQSYKAGNYTHVENFTLGDLPKFAGIPSNQVIVSSQIGFEHLEFNERSVAPNAKLNGGTSIFASQQVRQAFQTVFDRCAALRATLGVTNCNDPNVLTNEMTAPPAIDFDPTVTFPTYNVVAANALMDAAGYTIPSGGAYRTFKDGKTPITVVLTTTTGNTIRDAYMALMSAAYQQLSIKVVIQQYKAGKLFTTYDQGGILATGNYDVSLFAYVIGSDPDADTGLFQSDQIPSATNVGGGNFAGVNDPTVDQALKQGPTTADPAARATIYKNLQKYVAQQAFYEPLYIRAQISLTQTTLGNFKAQPDALGDTWNMADWYLTSGS